MPTDAIVLICLFILVTCAFAVPLRRQPDRWKTYIAWWGMSLCLIALVVPLIWRR